MHIPDGYMSLQTSIPLFGAMVPLWSAAARKTKKYIGGRNIPLLSLCAAFSFVIMMFNIPLGPSSIHAVGAVFIAVLMGPWAAMIAISVALVIQALVFGDGGILTLGANCFNMAFVMPFTGYYIYRAIAGKDGYPGKRSLAGIFAGSYIGINAAALFTAVEFGIQPLLFKNAAGIPEYGFYPLSVSVPAVMAEHLLAAGPIEAIITVLAVVYLGRFAPHLLDRAGEIAPASAKSPLSGYKALIVVIVVLIALVPLGLLATGTAWGEWSGIDVQKMLGYVPDGLQKLSGVWKALIPDYSIGAFGGGFFGSSAGYVISALAGVLLILALAFVSSRLMVKKDDTNKKG